MGRAVLQAVVPESVEARAIRSVVSSRRRESRPQDLVPLSDSQQRLRQRIGRAAGTRATQSDVAEFARIRTYLARHQILANSATGKSAVSGNRERVASVVCFPIRELVLVPAQLAM